MKAKIETMQGRLTVKQENFCLEYAKSGNAVQSYIKAYEKNSSYSAAGVESHRLLKNPKVQARLKELYETHNAKRIMQADEIQRTLTEIARNGNMKDRLKAIELLCKMGGLFISKQELEITQSIPVVIRDNV